MKKWSWIYLRDWDETNEVGHGGSREKPHILTYFSRFILFLFALHCLRITCYAVDLLIFFLKVDQQFAIFLENYYCSVTAKGLVLLLPNEDKPLWDRHGDERRKSFIGNKVESWKIETQKKKKKSHSCLEVADARLFIYRHFLRGLSDKQVKRQYKLCMVCFSDVQASYL
jgi:hypothetical protein